MTIVLPPEGSRVRASARPNEVTSLIALPGGVPGVPSAESFQGFRCRPEDLRRVFSRRFRYDRDATELMPMVQHLGERAAGSFSNLLQLRAQACGDGPVRPGTIWAMRDMFLDVANRHLQSLYRAHLRAFPPALGAPHQDKIAALASLRDAAHAIVADFDWRWLAEWLCLDRIGGSAEDCLLRLSNFAFQIQQVIFRFTHHCNIECRHCYNSSGPHAKARRIELDAMLGVIAQMPEANIPALNISGGEPFLYPDDLIALIAAGRAARLKAISVFTNGFWATTPEKTRAMLARLVAAGFMQSAGDYMKVSTGVYHQEFIEFDRIAMLARCFYETFGRRVRIDWELPPGKRGLATPLRQELAAAGLDHCAFISFREARPLGRGRDLEGAVLEPVDGPCRLIDQIVFEPDGSARPCGGFNDDNQGVMIGRLQTHRLRDLVKLMQNDPVLQFLASNPMNGIFKHIAIKKNEAGYAGTCNLCQHALGDLVDKEQLQARLFEQQEFYPFWFTRPAAIQ